MNEKRRVKEECFSLALAFTSSEEKVVEVRKQLFNDGPKATPGHDMISGTNGDICPRLSVRNEWKK